MIAFDLIAVGTSMGGLDALQVIFSGLPANFPVPIVVVQHRSKDANQSLFHFFTRVINLPMQEAEDKTAIVPEQIFFAPCDYHLLVEGSQFALSTEAPVHYARPSIDVLFESAARWYRHRLIGVILGGATVDGVEGARLVEEGGGTVIIQAPQEAETALLKKATLLPRSALAVLKNPRVLPLSEIAPFLVSLCCAR